MKLLLVGDIVGSPGRRAFAWVVSRMKNARDADMVVVNGENAAGGRGISRPLAQELFAAGADVITLGDHAWDQKDLMTEIDREPRIVRPANFAPGCPGRGWIITDTAWGKLAVLNLIGRVFMQPSDCPFRAADAALQQTGAARFIIVDFHAEATSEKVAMGLYLDGRVAVVAGTHTHVQTADETILPRGTAYITDLGMTGPRDSVIGRDSATIVKRFTTGMPAKFTVAHGGAALEGILVDLNDTDGKPRAIRRIRETMPPGSADRQ